jgi:hypothetical protein
MLAIASRTVLNFPRNQKLDDRFFAGTMAAVAADDARDRNDAPAGS